MSPRETVVSTIAAAISALSEFGGVPVQDATDMTEPKRGEKGACCYIRATVQRLSPNHAFYRADAVIVMETHSGPEEDPTGARLQEMADAVADWLHGVSGQSATSLGFDGILPGALSEAMDGARVQMQQALQVFLSHTPATA
jgi:hypothetical protein